MEKYVFQPDSGRAKQETQYVRTYVLYVSIYQHTQRADKLPTYI